MADVFLVTEGDYEDFKILQVFAERTTADSFVADYNAASQYHHAEVEARPLREAGWKPGESASMRTELALISGEIINTILTRHIDWAGEYEGDPVVNSRQAMGRWVVFTVGEALKVPAAHNKAVAEAAAKIQRAQGS